MSSTATTGTSVDIYTAIGLAGFAAYVAAYGLLQLGRIDGNGVAYTLLNIVAAGLVLVSLLEDFNLASVLIQVTWITLGLVGIVLRWSTPHPPKTLPISAQVTARLRT